MGRSNFFFYFFPRREISLGDIKFSITQVNKFLEANQGIRIYRDDFRVSPYGSPTGEGDWLNLSFRRQSSPGGVTQPGWRVGYNQVVGSAFITRKENFYLADQTNREGLLEGEAFNHLKAFALKTVEMFEFYRSKVERENKPKLINYHSARIVLHENINDSKHAVEHLKKIHRRVSRFVKTAQKGENCQTLG